MKKILFFFLLLVGISLQGSAGYVDTLEIYSPKMEKHIPVTVIVPDNHRILDVNYPVLYLLHGYSDNYMGWINKVPELKNYVDEFQMIVVCPDGGYNSWYFDSPVDEKVRYESFMTQILPKKIDSLYKTIPNKQHRAICGLSMGGHGAMYLALRHPELYGAVVSMSGGVDILPFPDNWDLKKVLGDPKTEQKNWEENSVINLVDQLRTGTFKIKLDIGRDDFFLEVNQHLHQKLIDLGVEHDYVERPGGHTWNYWRNAIPYEMRFFYQYFYPQY